MKSTSSKKSSSSKVGRPPRIDPEAYSDDPRKIKAILFAVTAGLAVVIFGAYMFLFSQGKLSSREAPEDPALASEKAALVLMRSNAELVAVERRAYWDGVIRHATPGMRPVVELVRPLVEGVACQENPEIDGKLLTLEQMRKVALLKERQCLQLIRPSVVHSWGVDEVAVFMDGLIAELGREYQRP